VRRCPKLFHLKSGSRQVASRYGIPRSRLCVFPRIWTTPGWNPSRGELSDPNNARSGPNDGFVSLDDLTEQFDSPGETLTDHTIGFHTQADLQYYYALAETFAVHHHPEMEFDG